MRQSERHHMHAPRGRLTRILLAIMAALLVGLARPTRAQAAVTLTKDGLESADRATCVIDVDSYQDFTFEASEGAPFRLDTRDGVFKEYVDSTTVGGQTVALDYKDKRVPFIPEHTFAATADYRIDFGSLLRSLTLGANLTAQGKTYWDEANTYEQKLYAVLGAHADADFGNLVVSLWGRNLTDTKYNTFATPSSMAGSLNYYAHRGNPLQLGVDVRLHF